MEQLVDEDDDPGPDDGAHDTERSLPRFVPVDAERTVTDLLDRGRRILDGNGRRPDADYNVEANLGVLGLGGTGVRVSSEMFQDDPTAPGLSQSYGFDLDSDEQVPPCGPQYAYTLIRQTGGIPAAGIFAFSQMIAEGILEADPADLDSSAARFQQTIQHVVASSLYNVTVPVFSAGGGVGHGLFRAITAHVQTGRTLAIPLIVQPASMQPLPIRVSAAAAAGRFLHETPYPSVVTVDNDILETTGWRDGRRYRNRPITRALRITAAAIEHAFARQEAEGNVDRPLLNLARGSGTTRATLGTGSARCFGTGEASLLAALEEAVENPLARLDGRRRRLMVFAVVPERMDVEQARRVLEHSRFNAREHGYELIGTLIGRTRSYTCDVAVWTTGAAPPGYLDDALRTLPSQEISREIDAKVDVARVKLDKLVQDAGLREIVDVDRKDEHLEAARRDMETGVRWLKEEGGR